MIHKNVPEVTKDTKPNQDKKPYASPVLQMYGTLHRLTQGTGAFNGDGGMGMMVTSSDRSLKENIVQVGQHSFGIGLYLFDYKPEYRERWGRGRQFGVMAQEVELVMPVAVSVHPDGYKMVDYAMLGISHRIQ